MTYNIVTLSDNKANINEVKRVLHAIGQKFGKTFTYEDCFILNAEINPTTIPNEALEKSKHSHAVLFDFTASPNLVNIKKELQRISHSLGLYAKLNRVKTYPALLTASAIKSERLANGVNIMTVCDIPSDKNSNDKGFGNNQTFGREAYDVERYSELEIERVARIAYELSEKRCRHITLADKADKLYTSRLWRKIVTDINEDYPYVKVETHIADDVVAQLVQNTSCFDVILAPNTYGEVFANLTAAIVGNTGITAMLGDTALGIYGILPTSPSLGKNVTNPVGIIMSAALMLRISFDMQQEADCIEKAVEKAIADGCLTDCTNTTASIITNQILARI